jgi:curli production assembly/transport component CsgG
MKALSALLVLLLTSCASIPHYKVCNFEEGFGRDIVTGIAKRIPFECIEDPEVIELPTYEQLMNLPPAETMPIVAVYEFKDLTGQRKSKDNLASFSTAVTQGGTELLIDALKTAAKVKWFRVVERQGIDNLVRERQIVRSTREEHDEDKGIQPMLFAGIILEGGIIGYDTNMESGGRGGRYLGIGHTSMYRRDVVTVSLRGISTLSGEVLLNVQARKTILSYGEGLDLFRFIDLDTELIEFEDGVAKNESVTVATRAAIEAAVVAIIKQGDKRGYWKLKWSEGEKNGNDE